MVGFSRAMRGLLPEFVAPIPLQIEKTSQVSVLKMESGCRNDGGLAAKGNAKTDGLQHRDIIGAIADRGRGVERDRQSRRDLASHAQFAGAVENGFLNAARDPSV